MASKKGLAMTSKNTRIIAAEQRVGLLRATGIFDGLDETVLEHLAGRMKESRIAARRNVVSQGVRAHRFYIIAAGTAEVALIEKGRKKKLATLKSGEFFGEMALLDSSQKRLATVTAKSRLLLLSLETRAFQDILASHPEIAKTLNSIADKRKQINDLKKSEPDKRPSVDKLRKLVDKFKWW